MSTEEDAASLGIKTKSRRLQNACLNCRQRKIRCDSGNMPGNICSNCIAFGSVCTHTPSRRGKKRAPSQERSQTSSPFNAEDQFTAIRSIVSDVLSSEETSSSSLRLPQDPATLRRTLVDFAKYITELEKVLIPSQVPEYVDSSVGFSSGRFFGRSSNSVLLNVAIDLKKGQDTGFDTTQLHHMRPEFWMPNPRERLHDTRRPLIFPTEPLMTNLVDLYFSHLIKVDVFPLLHRESFQRSLSEGLHYRDYFFGATVLGVCAIASRYSVSVNPSDDATGGAITPGWEWFSQIYPPTSSFVSPASLHEVQLYCLLSQYLQGTSIPEAAWTLAGVGLRCAIEVGAHRRDPHLLVPTPENELWKRAFWALVSLDITMGSYFGRPRALQPEDYDQELPIECDDEYWTGTETSPAFHQPHGQPSSISFWNILIRLNDVLGLVQRSMYGVNTNFPPTTEVAIRLDTELNKWIELIPAHLRWNAQIAANSVYLDQSAALHTSFYYVQILIHKPFISAVHRLEDVSTTSLAICVGAARSSNQIMELQAQKGSLCIPSANVVANCAIVLLINIWRNRKLSAGVMVNLQKDMQEVYRCIALLRSHEKRYPAAGRTSDFIEELISLGETRLFSLADPLTAPSFDWTSTLGQDWMQSAFTTGNMDYSNSGPDLLASVFSSWSLEWLPPKHLGQPILGGDPLFSGTSWEDAAMGSPS